MTSAVANFTSFIEWLNRSYIPYFIAWGYERLPEEHSGGDVDICVYPSCYMAVAEELARRGYSSAKCPAYSEAHRHEQFAQSGSYSLDIFSSFCFPFMGKIMVLNVDSERIFRVGRIRWKEFWVSSPIAETLFTALRIVGGRKDENCMERIKKHLI